MIKVSKLEVEASVYSRCACKGPKDGNKSMILNFKKLNKFVNYKYLEMESIYNVINFIQPNLYMASIDLSDVLFLVGVHVDDQKIFKFNFDNLFQFSRMPGHLYHKWVWTNYEVAY